MATIKVEYNDLDEELKEKVREHFINDEYLVPEDWYQYIIESFEEKYENIINFDMAHMSFDMDRRDFNLNGYMYFDHPEISKLIPKKFDEYDEKGWFYSIEDEFVNGEITKEHELDELSIQLFITEDVFLYDLTEDFVNGKAEIDVKSYKKHMDDNLKKYGHYSEKVSDIFKKWIDLLSASEVFFQDYIEIEEDDYNHVLGSLIDDTIYEVDTFMTEKYYENIEPFIRGVHNEFIDNLTSSYEYYFSEEYADVSLDGRMFEVELDEDGNQEEVIDLDGEF